MISKNERRIHAVRVSRSFKDLFSGWRGSSAHWWRRLFLSDEERLRLSAERVIADLRDFCFAHSNNRRMLFSSDPLIMARRLGRREVFDRIIMYLNLDEAEVQKLMEIDDGN